MDIDVLKEEFHMGINYMEAQYAKAGIALAAVGLLFLVRWVMNRPAGDSTPTSGRSGQRGLPLWLVVVLGVAAASTVAVYYRIQPRLVTTRIEAYDVYHYYINSKYFDELQYDRLYACSLVADTEGKDRFVEVKSLRDLTNYELVPRRSVLTMTSIQACKSRFSEERWESFVRDVSGMGARVPPDQRRRLFHDRGYNGTPAWTMMGGLASDMVRRRHVKQITLIDTALVAVAFGFVAWAYGPATMFFCVLLYFSMWPARWPFLGGGLLRCDWFACLVVSMCLVKKGKHKSGGAVAAWAVAGRIFPLALVGTLGIKMLTEIKWRGGAPLKDRIPRRYLGFFGGFALALAAITGATVLVNGAGQYQSFASNLKVHTAASNISFQRVGFPVAIQYRGEVEEQTTSSAWFKGKKQAMDDAKPLVRGVTLLVILLSFLVVRRMDDDQAMGWGVAVFFTATSASYYYWIILVCAALAHLSRPRSLKDVLALAMLFVGSTIVHVMERTSGFRYLSMAALSVWLTLYVLFVLVTSIWPRSAKAAPQLSDDASA